MSNPTRAQILADAGYVPRIGRPPVGDALLPHITVPVELLHKLTAQAATLGLSMPNARREAYTKWVGADMQ